LALALGATAFAVNCGEEQPRKTGVSSADRTPSTGTVGGTGATAGPSGPGEGTAGHGGQQPPSDCAQVTSNSPAASFGGIWISPMGEIWVAGVDGWIGHDTSSRSGGGGWSFCQRSPGVNLRAIWGATDTDIWAVGDGGTVLHWEGQRWTAIADVGAPAPGDLYDVWGDVGAHTAWIVGRNGVVRRFDSSGWHVDDTDARYSLTGVWGTPTGTLRVVGFAALPPLPGEVIAGEEAVVLRRSGATWEREGVFIHEHGAASFSAIDGTSEGDIWAVGARYDAGAAQGYGFAAHFDGTSWTPRAGLGVPGGPPEQQLDMLYDDVVAGPPQAPAGALIATSPNHTLFDGTTWTTSSPGLTALDRRGDALWATGAPGQILHWTGTAWEVDISP
jgi:hypothetical protein